MNNILNYKLIGIGEFSHGIQESWQFRFNLLKYAMKKNFTEKDAIFESCFGSMSKVEWCDKLLKKNPKNLMIHYLPHQDNKFYDYGQYIVKSLKN
jgi:hypothetical protein